MNLDTVNRPKHTPSKSIGGFLSRVERTYEKEL